MGPKRYLGPRDPIIGNTGLWGVNTYSSGYGLLSRKLVYTLYMYV